MKDFFTIISFKEILAFQTEVFPNLDEWLEKDQREVILVIEDNSGSNCVQDFLARVFSGSGWGRFGEH